MDLLEQIQSTYGKRVLLDTPLRTAHYNTDSTEFKDIGIQCVFTFTLTTQTILKERVVKSNAADEFHHARKEAASYMARELYGEIADRLVEISYKDYELNRSGDSEVRQMINQLIDELRI